MQLRCKLYRLPFPVLSGRMTDKLWSFTPVCLADVFLIMNKVRERMSLQGQIDNTFYQSYIQAFGQKLECWKMCIHHHKLHGFTILKTFLIRSVEMVTNVTT